MNAGRVKDLLETVQNKGHECLMWRRFYNKADIPVKKDCLLRVVTIMLTDEPVKRTDPLVGSSANCPTIGDWEANGLIQCEVQVSGSCCRGEVMLLFAKMESITAINGGYCLHQ